MKRRKCLVSRGYSLMEMLVAISLMGVALAIFGRVVVASVTVQGAVHDAAWTQDRMNQVLRALRMDVWRADELIVRADGSLETHAGSLGVARWMVVPSTEDQKAEDVPRWLLRRETQGSDDGPLRDAREYVLPAFTKRPCFESAGLGVVGLELGHGTWWFASEQSRLKRKGGA